MFYLILCLLALGLLYSNNSTHRQQFRSDVAALRPPSCTVLDQSYVSRTLPSFATLTCLTNRGQLPRPTACHTAPDLLIHIITKGLSTVTKGLSTIHKASRLKAVSYCFFSQDKFQALFLLCVAVAGDLADAASAGEPLADGVPSSSSSRAEPSLAPDVMSPRWRFGLGMSSEPPRLLLEGGTSNIELDFESLKEARRPEGAVVSGLPSTAVPSSVAAVGSPEAGTARVGVVFPWMPLEGKIRSFSSCRAVLSAGTDDVGVRLEASFTFTSLFPCG